MTRANKPDESLRSRLFTKEGKPLKILSTSLGVALLANMLLPAVADAATPTSTASANAPAQLVAWSTDEVKQYFDPAVDWNLPILIDDNGNVGTNQQGNEQGSGNNTSSGGTTGIHTSSGFGWDDLILYHLLFNSGSSYSSSGWSSGRPTYYSGTTTRYQPKTYTAETFQNKPVAGSSVRPKTTDSTGTVTRRSTTSKPGGIGGKSSGYSSGGTHSSGGFGG